MNKMTASGKLEQKLAAKPLQAHTPSSQGLNDAEIAALLAKVTAQKGLSNVFCQRYVQLTSFSRDWQVEEKSGIKACRDIKRDQVPAEINKSSRCYGSSQ